jgi:hypothetical protein
MKSGYLNKAVIVLTIVTILGFGTNVFAQQGAGYCPKVCVNQDPGQNRFCRNRCCMNKLSEEQIKAMNEKRKAFFDATEDLRHELYEREAELISVLAKKEPDAEKARAVQKEISALESQMHQKTLDHIIKMKKINPYCGRKACWLRDRDRGCCR